MAILMGFDVTETPTADLMELAAKLLEIDHATILKFVALVETMTDQPVGGKSDANLALAEALRERAARIRHLETQ